MLRLDYDKFNNYFGCLEDWDKLQFTKAAYVVEEIKQRREKAKVKQEAIDNLIYEKNLINEDIVNIIKHDLDASTYNIFYGFTTELLRKAWAYSGHKDDEQYWSSEDENVKRSKEEYEAAFKYTTEGIKRAILNNDDNYKLEEIVDYCFSAGYSFTYSYKNVKIQVTIPVWANTSKDNYLDMLSGYRVHYQESEYCWDLVTHDIDYRKVATVLETWIKEHAE